MGDIITHPR